jgi:hypothetical protein
MMDEYLNHHEPESTALRDLPVPNQPLANPAASFVNIGPEFPLNFDLNTFLDIENPEAGSLRPTLQDSLAALEMSVASAVALCSLPGASNDLPNLRTQLQRLESQIKSLRTETDLRDDIREIREAMQEMRPQLARAHQHTAQPSSRERDLERKIQERESAIHVLWGELVDSQRASNYIHHVVSRLAPNVILHQDPQPTSTPATDSCQQVVDPRELIGKGKQPEGQTPRSDSAYFSR